MKKYFISFAICFCFSLSVIAQSKIRLFCKIIITTEKNGDGVSIDYGKKENLALFKDSSILNKLERVNTFNNSIDSTNYLSSIGWELVSAFPLIRQNSGEKYICIFKKEIER